MRKDFFNSVYDLWWEKQTKIYGVSKYEKHIIHEIVKRKPDKVFEVAIGNGWPIGGYYTVRILKFMGAILQKD